MFEKRSTRIFVFIATLLFGVASIFMVINAVFGETKEVRENNQMVVEFEQSQNNSPSEEEIYELQQNHDIENSKKLTSPDAEFLTQNLEKIAQPWKRDFTLHDGSPAIVPDYIIKIPLGVGVSLNQFYGEIPQSIKDLTLWQATYQIEILKNDKRKCLFGVYKDNGGIWWCDQKASIIELNKLYILELGEKYQFFFIASYNGEEEKDFAIYASPPLNKIN